VKFIFATTEIRKVPITVLSRCQRFDLRRIESGRLVELMKGIAAKESIEIEDAALLMVARAAEGSARDSLSILDQAIAHASGKVEGEAVRQMLGLADRALVIDLFEEVMRGDVAGALARLKALFDVGADPAVVLEDLAAFTHVVTTLKLAPGAADDALTEEERRRGGEFASKLSVRVLARAWQMLLKGIEETREAPRPLAAADMVLVRIAHAADLPTPEEALRALKEGGALPSGGARGAAASAAPPSRGSVEAAASSSGGDGRTRLAAVGGAARAAVSQPRPAPAPAAPAVQLASYEDLVALAGRERELKLKHALEHLIRPIRFENGRIEVAFTPEAPPGLAGELSGRLEAWTGRRWMVVVGNEAAQPTIAEMKKAAKQQLFDDAAADPLVAAVMARFPGASVTDVRLRGTEPEAAEAPAAGDAADSGSDYPDDPGYDAPPPAELDDNFEPDDGYEA
jgi:DNA polymerase-3 subunit gamma/tau